MVRARRGEKRMIDACERRILEFPLAMDAARSPRSSNTRGGTPGRQITLILLPGSTGCGQKRGPKELYRYSVLKRDKIGEGSSFGFAVGRHGAASCFSSPQCAWRSSQRSQRQADREGTHLPLLQRLAQYLRRRRGLPRSTFQSLFSTEVTSLLQVPRGCAYYVTGGKMPLKGCSCVARNRHLLFIGPSRATVVTDHGLGHAYDKDFPIIPPS
jgi:hypothetical protein